MTDFSQLGLRPEVLQAVIDTGYTTPTPIQEQAIPVAMAGRDVLGIAQTGTGKTAAFTLPMINRLASGRSKAQMPRALVLEPTRELADQVSASFERYAKGTKLFWALLIGGVSFDEQLKKLDRGVDVLIATPGRLLDLHERGKLMLIGVEMMVVDEADRMLDMGFIPDIERIFKLTPPRRQTLFFSATMPPEITRLTTQFLKDPTRIEATRPAMTAETISQFVVQIPTAEPKAKRAALRAIIDKAELKNAIVFCNRKSEVDVVAKSLAKHGLDASPIHGDLDQSQRTKTLERFRSGELKILVASDVAARGLDIPDVSHVLNYDVPHHAEDYVHRIGRTGRAGRKGETFMIVTPADAKNYDKVLKLTKKEPETVSLDLDWGHLEEAGRSDGERRKRSPAGRGGERDRERGRGAHRGEAREARAAATATDAVSHEPDAPAADIAQGDGEAPRERSRRDRSSRDGAPSRERAPRERSARRDKAPDQDRDPPRQETGADGEPSRRDLEPRAASADERPSSDRLVNDRSSGDRGPSDRGPSDRSSGDRYGRERGSARAGDPSRGGGREPSRPREDGREDRGGPVGFGADTPAFLLRATPLAPAKDLAEADA